MPDRAKLEDLLRRVEGAKADDRWPTDVSDAITRALFGPDWTLADWGLVRDALNGSVDAALALAEKVAPEWSLTIGVNLSGEGKPYVDASHDWLAKPRLPAQYGDGATLPLTILSAILRATLAKGAAE